MEHNYFKLLKSMNIDSKPKADTQINELIGQGPDLKFKDEFKYENPQDNKDLTKCIDLL